MGLAPTHVVDKVLWISAHLVSGRIDKDVDALNANKASITAREAAELLKLKRALEAKAKRLLTPRSASALLPEKSVFL
jgi:hypothetical protein